MRHGLAYLPLVVSACAHPAAEPSAAMRSARSASVERAPAPSAAGSTGRKTAAPPSGTAAASQRLDTTQASVAFELAVDDAIVVGAQLVVLDRGSRSVSGYSVASGTKRWTRPFQTAAVGGQLLQRLGKDQVLVRGDDKLTVIALSDGSLVVQHAIRLEDRAYLWERDGACGLRGSCSVQLVDCQPAKPLGPPIRGKIKSRMSYDGSEHHSGCWGFDVQLLGRARATIVYVARDAEGAAADSAVGFDAAAGRIGWQSPAIQCAYCLDHQIGMSPDGTACWSWGGEALVGFDCATGTVRWSRPVGEPRLAIWAGDDTGGVFVAGGATATLFDPNTGAARWTVPVVPDEVPLPTRGRVPPLSDVSMQWSGPKGFVLLDPKNGAIVEHKPGAAWVVRGDAPGQIVLSLHRTERDQSGQAIEQLDPPVTIVSRGRAAGTGKGPPNEALLSRRTGTTPFAELDHDGWLLGELADANGVLAVLMVATEPKSVRIYRIARELTAQPGTLKVDGT
jgi:hypothetical protein